MKNKKIQFFYSYSVPSFNDFENAVLRLKQEYEINIESLKSRRDALLKKYDRAILAKLIADHNKMINELVLKIVNLYSPVIKDKPFGIYWNGSFAKNSNRLSSDYDLNFVYPDELKSDLLPVEEQICYLLTKVTDRPRDLVHSPIASHLSSADFAEGKLFFRMNWSNAYEEYEISAGLEGLMLRSYLSSRAKEVFQKFFFDNILPMSCNGWPFYKIIYGEDILQPAFDEIAAEEKRRFKTLEFKESFNKLIQDRKDIIKNLLSLPASVCTNKIKDIKEYYKKNPIDQIYVTLNLLKRKIIMDGEDVEVLKIDECSKNKHIRLLLGDQLFNDFFEMVYEYFWNVIRLEAIFEKQKLRFGVHSRMSVGKVFFERYKKECPEVKDFHFYHDIQLKKLYRLIEQVLTKMG